MKRVSAETNLKNDLGIIGDLLDLVETESKLKIKSIGGVYFSFDEYKDYFVETLYDLNFDEIPDEYIAEYMINCLIKSVDYIDSYGIYVSTFYDDIRKLGHEIYNNYNEI